MNMGFFIGNLTRDPEQFETNNGKIGTNFDIAVNNNDAVLYIHCTAWGPLGVVCAEHLAKGKKVAVTGPVEIHAYLNRDNEPAATLNIPFLEKVEFLSPKEKEPEKKKTYYKR